METPVPDSSAAVVVDADGNREPSLASASVQRLSSLTIVLPSFNEAENVERAVLEALAAGERFAEGIEVVVVDDGSSDGTGELAERLADGDQRVRCVKHAVNRGYGAALRSGIDAAASDFILLTDGDLQFDLNQLDRFVPVADRADLIVGRRVNRQDNAIRRINAGAWGWLVRRTIGITVRDPDCAFKLLNSDLAGRLNLVADGAMISPELIAKSTRAGARIEEIDVAHRPRLAGSATGNNPRVILRAFRELRKLRAQLVVA